MKVLGFFFWFPVAVVSFYSHFAMKEDEKMWGAIAVAVTTLLSIGLSMCTGMSIGFSSWYHEILLCGVNKVSMSITSISYPDADIETRSWWMAPFEAFFGISIKFFNPALLCYMLLENI